MDSKRVSKRNAHGGEVAGLGSGSRELQGRLGKAQKISVLRPDRDAAGDRVARSLDARPALGRWLGGHLRVYRAAGTNNMCCSACQRLVAASATITIHKCSFRPPLPPAVEAEVVEPCGHRSRCTLCQQYVKAGHACPLGPLSTLVVDTLGLSFMPPPAYQRASKHGQALHEQMGQLARSNCLLCLTLVQLPGETNCSQTLTYLGTSSIPDCASFERLADERFRHVPPPGGGSGLVSMPAVRYLPSPSLPPRLQPTGPPADGNGVATNPDGASKAPRFLYCGPYLSLSADKEQGTVDSGFSRMESTITVRSGRRSVRRTTVTYPELYGSMAYKLNHACDAKLEARCVPLPAWGDGVSLNVIEVPHDRPATFQAHEELLWCYDAICDTPAEEVLCCCGSAQCGSLLARWKGRGDGGERAAVLDAQGQPVDMARWSEWLRAQHGAGGASL